MAAGVYNFTVEQGTTLDLKLLWKDETGTLVPLPGYTARLQVRGTLASTLVLQEFTTENGGISLVSPGEIHILASAATTSSWTNWPKGAGQILASGVYDLELVSGSGVVTRLLKGTISLDPEVTR